MLVLSRETLHSRLDLYVNQSEPLLTRSSNRINFADAEAAILTIPFPKIFTALPHVSNFLATLGYETRHFNGALLWMSQYGIWDEQLEGIGYHLIETLCAGSGQVSAFENTGGYEFRADELLKATGFLMQPILFGWDAYYFPSWSWGGCSEYFLEISHDEVIRIHTKSRAYHDFAVRCLVRNKFELLADRNGNLSVHLSKSDLEDFIKSDAGGSMFCG